MRYTRPLPPVWNWSKVVIDADKDMAGRNLSNLNEIYAQKIVSPTLDAFSESITTNTLNAQQITTGSITATNSTFDSVSFHTMWGEYHLSDNELYSKSGDITGDSTWHQFASCTITRLVPSPTNVRFEIGVYRSPGEYYDSKTRLYIDDELKLEVTTTEPDKIAYSGKYDFEVNQGSVITAKGLNPGYATVTSYLWIYGDEYTEDTRDIMDYINKTDEPGIIIQ